MLIDAEIDLSMYGAAPLSFAKRVDVLCDEVAAIEKLLQACTEADSADGFSAELIARVGATALGAQPGATNTDAERTKRRQARQARLEAARASRIASQERRDALKAELAESRFRWKLAITANEEQGRWRVRISEAAGGTAAKAAAAALDPAQRPVMSEEHTAALSARVHEEELLRAAMAAERTANAKERAATELERQAMVKERAIQHELDVHTRLLAEETANAAAVAAEEKVRPAPYLTLSQYCSDIEADHVSCVRTDQQAKEEALAEAAEVAALEAAELQAGMAREHRLKMMTEQRARDEKQRLERLEQAEAQQQEAETAAKQALAKKKKRAMATLAAVDALSKAHDEADQKRRDEEAATRAKLLAEHTEEVEQIKRRHAEAADAAARQRAAAAASKLLATEQVERARQRESERRVREERWAADRKARQLLEKQEAAEKLAKDTAVRQAALEKLRNAESRVLRAQEQARLVAAQAEKAEVDRVKKMAREGASQRAQELLRLQSTRAAMDTRREEQLEAHRRATLLLSDTSWSGGGGSGTGSVARWNSADVLEWFTKSFRWAGAPPRTCPSRFKCCSNH
jgi:hypothetical protein